MRATEGARLCAIVRALDRATGLLPHLGDTFALGAQEANHARDKFIQEAALFLLIAGRAASRCPGGLDDEALQRLLEALVRAFDLEAFRAAMKAFPQAALAFGPLAAAMAFYGHPDHLIPSTVREATQSEHYLAVDRVTFRELEALWLRKVIRHEARGFGHRVHGSIISRRTHPFFLRVSDAYAKTHCAMYLTDFGEERRLDGVDEGCLKSDLDHDLSWTFGSADWDLLGEVVLAGRYCLETLSPWHRPCEAALDAVFDKFGFIPTRTFDPGKLASFTDERREAYRAFHSYHSTVVYGLGLLNRQSRAKGYDRASSETCGSIDESFRILGEIGAPLEMMGSGFDPNWYDAAFQEVDIDADFVREALLIRVFREHGADCARRFIRAASNPPPGSRSAETWRVLERHAEFVDRMASR